MRQSTRFSIWPIAFAILAPLTAPGTAWAHALGAECKLRDGKVHVEAFFEDDTPAQEARVRVLGEDGLELLQTKTDAQGRCSFIAPTPGRYQLVVDDGAGHRVELRMTIPQSTVVTTSEPVTQGPGREEFTRFPWMRVIAGLSVILAVAVAFLISRHMAGSASPPKEIRS